MREALADPVHWGAALAALAAALAAALSLRLLYDHAAELAVIAAALCAAWALSAQLRAGSRAAGGDNAGAAVEEVTMDADMEATKAAFQRAFAAAASAQVEAVDPSQEVLNFNAAAAAGPGAPFAVVPLDAVSAYNDEYVCSVHCAVFSEHGVAVCVAARGDGSLGPLQSAELSQLLATPAGGGEERRAAAERVTWHDANGEDAVRAVLHFPRGAAARGDALDFKFGDPFGGYQPASLCVLDQAFVELHSLQQLLL